jgi:hypothetical protein
MNRLRSTGAPAVSQFQLIGGIRHEAGDCIVSAEPGGATQVRKGALYLVTEPAGDPALGGEACALAQATLAHEYYADPSPSVTTSLTNALNKANGTLIQYNRKVLATSDPPAGLPRKIRVGLSAAIVRPGQMYLCQLKPGLILWTHQDTVSAFPRPAQWVQNAATLNGDGEIVGNFYPAAPLGTGPLVEADYAFRRFDSGDLLILCSSNLAGVLDEDALAAALPGRPAADVVEYLYNLARDAGLAEAHAMAVEMSAAPVSRRSTQPITLPPPPAWAPEATPDPPHPAAPPPAAPEEPDAPVREVFAPRAGAEADGAPPDEAAAPQDGDRRVLQLRPRRATPPAPPPEEPESGAPHPPTQPIPLHSAAASAHDFDAALGATTAEHEEGDRGLPPDEAEPAGPSAAREGLDKLIGRARLFGRKAAPVVGTAGKATLGAAGTMLGHTLPENVRQRGAAGMLNPDGVLEIEDLDEDPDAETAGDDEYEPEPATEANRVIDFDAPRHAPAAPAPPFPWMRWLIPIAVVALLGVLLFAVQQILAGQQTARIDVLLQQAQREESDGQDGPVPARRDHLLKALNQVQTALDIDPKSQPAMRLNTRIQSELDSLNGVVRLSGLNLLLDLSTARPATSTTTAAPALPTDTPDVGATPSVTDSTALAPLIAPPKPGDYFSQVVVNGDDAFLLDKGSGRLYRYKMATSQYSPILGAGDQVELVGTAGEKAAVGALLFMAWRPTTEGGDLIALDDARVAYIWTPATGQWQAFRLGGADKLDRPRDLGTYDGNLYLLGTKPGQISKWAAGAYNNDPVDWMSEAASNEIRNRGPVAMTIDGDIHLLLGDGRIVTMSAGEIKNTIALNVWPQVASPLAIFTTETAHSLYVVEVADKRIIRVDKAGGAVQGQLKAPADSTAFDGLRNIYVDEAAGKLYALSGKKLYVATLPPLPTAPGTPAPALPAADATPTAAPAVTATAAP